ncbi:hypothetical protein [Methylomonas sp. DH-1]|uniref:hypothetical protein n=1 Tax=Methylomonas sp. (strain DH-1) TaxID=1727196 RepID=UPI000AEFC20E|nr:hypothetical protein [Methylomonas sp. DH-1]
MSASSVKKTAVTSSPLTSIKPAGTVAMVPDSTERISYWQDQVEDFLTELSKLRCLSGLLNGQNEHNNITLSELCYLIDPSVERLKDICDELSDLFYQKQVAFVQAADERGNPTDAA